MTDFRTLVKEIRNDPAPLEAYEGRSLGQAFWKLMFGDHRFYDAQHAAQGREICGMKCNASNTGPKWPSRSGLWPMQPGPLDLVMGWLDPDVTAYGVECEPDGSSILKSWVTDDFGKLSTIWDAARVVEALLDRFLAPLRDGRVVASGHAVSDNRPLGPISPAVWSRPATRFDAVNSGVARWTGWTISQFHGERHFRSDALFDEFQAVTLDLAKPVLSNVVPSNPVIISADSAEVIELRDEIARLKNEAHRLRKIEHDKRPIRRQQENGTKWEYAFDKVVYRIYIEKLEFDRRGEFMNAVLKILDDVDQTVNTGQLSNHFKTHYPDFWNCLNE